MSKSTNGAVRVRIIVLTWSAGLLTASYAGFLPKMDPTFIASIFTASLATFGVDAVKKDAPGAPKAEEPKVESTPPTPPVLSAIDAPVVVEEKKEDEAPGAAAPVP